MAANLQLTMRWYGIDDRVSLRDISQIPSMKGVVTALHQLPAGEVWDVSRLKSLKKTIESAGLSFSVIESIPVHEDIKTGKGDRDKYIEAYKQSLKNVGAVGIPVVVYNFMPIFDWMRTDLAMSLPDGSTCLNYIDAVLESIDLSEGTGDLPGWSSAYSAEQLAKLRKDYEGVDEEQLWKNLEYFLKAIVPVAEASGVKLAIHPDDPPWSIFGLPRIIVDEKSMRRVCDIVKSPANGITLCTGSLGANPDIDLAGMARRLKDKIHFVHGRNVRTTGYRSFFETSHDDEKGNVSLPAVIQTLYDVGYSGPIRPDHGRMIWGEEGRPGYGLYDRALGASFIWGIWRGCKENRSIKKKSFIDALKFWR